jgi:hypothetical protein
MKSGRKTIPDFGKEYAEAEPVIRIKDSHYRLSMDSIAEQEEPDESGLFDAVADTDIASSEAVRQQIDEKQKEQLENLRRIIKIMLSTAEELSDEDLEWSLENDVTINGIKKAREQAEIEKERLRKALKLLHNNCKRILDILENPSGLMQMMAKGRKLKKDLKKTELLLENISRQLDPKNSSEMKRAKRKWRKLPDKNTILEMQSASGFTPLAVQRFRQIVRYLQRELQEAQLKHGVYTIRIDTIGEFVRRRLDQIKELQRDQTLTPDGIRSAISKKIREGLPDL